MIDPAKIAKHALMKERGCRDCLYYDSKKRDCSIGTSHCVLFEERRADPSGRFAYDKPKYCRNCYWWNRRGACCRRGGLERCAYLIWAQPEQTRQQKLELCMEMLDGVSGKELEDLVAEATVQKAGDRWAGVESEAMRKLRDEVVLGSGQLQTEEASEESEQAQSGEMPMGSEQRAVCEVTGHGECIPCKDCPYGKERPCVSFCMRKILQEWRAGKHYDGKEAAVYA